jgi:hypothetical protein
MVDPADADAVRARQTPHRNDDWASQLRRCRRDSRYYYSLWNIIMLITIRLLQLTLRATAAVRVTATLATRGNPVVVKDELGRVPALLTARGQPARLHTRTWRFRVF